MLFFRLFSTHRQIQSVKIDGQERSKTPRFSFPVNRLLKAANERGVVPKLVFLQGWLSSQCNGERKIGKTEASKCAATLQVALGEHNKTFNFHTPQFLQLKTLQKIDFLMFAPRPPAALLKYVKYICLQINMYFKYTFKYAFQ